MASFPRPKFQPLHAGDVRVAILSLVAALSFGYAGWRIHRIGTAQREQIAHSRVIVRALDRWRSEFLAFTPAESAAWVASDRAARQLGTSPGTRLAMARTLAALAERAGLADVRASIVESDTTPAPARPSIGELQPQAAPFAIVIDFRGSLGEVASLLRTTPASVAVYGLTIRPDRQPRSRILFVVYELDTSNVSSE